MKFSRIFTFLRENNILLEVKTALLKFVKHEYKELKPKLEAFIKNKAPIAKEALIEYLLNNISLPLYLKPFKFVVRNVVDKNIDKIVEFILSAL